MSKDKTKLSNTESKAGIYIFIFWLFIQLSILYLYYFTPHTITTYNSMQIQKLEENVLAKINNNIPTHTSSLPLQKMVINIYIKCTIYFNQYTFIYYSSNAAMPSPSHILQNIFETYHTNEN
jgi:hypothetical protein